MRASLQQLPGTAAGALVSAVALILLAPAASWASETAAAPVDLNRSDLNAFRADPTPGDFDGDGLLDLVVSVPGVYQVDASVAFGDGSGDFSEPTGQTTVGFGYPPFPAADVSGDGRDDLLFTGRLGLSLGDGRFDLDNTGPPATRPKATDLDADGDLDLVSTEANTLAEEGALTAYLNESQNGFQQSSNVAYPSGVRSAGSALGDFDGDGATDVAVCIRALSSSSPASAGLRVYLNDGMGRFASSSVAGSSESRRCLDVATGDLDGDGIDDVVTDRFSVFTGTPQQGLQPGVPIRSGADPASSVEIADMNRDGTEDALFTTGGIEIWLGRGDGTFVSSPQLRFDAVADELQVVSLDGDGEADDLLTTRPDFGGSTIWRNTTNEGEALPDTDQGSGDQFGISRRSLPDFAFGSDDPEANIECSLDFGPYRRCSEGFDQPVADGRHVVRGRAVNSAGADPTPSQQVVLVDSVTPMSRVIATTGSEAFPRFAIEPYLTDSERSIYGSVRVAGSAAEPQRFSGNRILDEGDYFSGTAVDTRDLLRGSRRTNRGPHELIVRTRDPAGNASIIRRTFRVR